MTSTTEAPSSAEQMRNSAEPPVLEVDNLHRTVSYQKILRGVSFELYSGQALAVVGPNGAGKTTLLRAVTGLARSSRGTVKASGNMALVAHESMLYDALSARENLKFFARLHGVEDRAVVDRTIDLVGLTGRMHDRIGTYSRGMKQRISIARALIGDPEILCLDEPLTGLDERSCSSVMDILLRLREDGRAIVFVSHNFSAVAQLATHVGYLVGGKMTLVEEVVSHSPDEVHHRYREVVENG